MRNELLAAAALAAALTAGCRRPQAPPPKSEAATLAVPAPSSATVTSPLAAAASGYTNEMQAENLRGQAAALGIGKLTKPDGRQFDEDDARPPISYDEGLERTRVMAKEFEAERREFERGKPKAVALPGTTPEILPANKEGAPVSGPKDLEEK